MDHQGSAFVKLQEELVETMGKLRQQADIRECTLLRLFRELRKDGVSPNTAAKSATQFIVAVFAHL